jgi:hypothetical protein
MYRKLSRYVVLCTLVTGCTQGDSPAEDRLPGNSDTKADGDDSGETVLKCHADLGPVPCNNTERSTLDVVITGNRFTYSKFIPRQCFADEYGIFEQGTVLRETFEANGAEFIQLRNDTPDSVWYQWQHYIHIPAEPGKAELIEILVRPLWTGTEAVTERATIACE